MRPLALLLAAWLASVAAAPAGRARLDPRLVLATQPGAEPVPVWVEFADKGEHGPADLAARLAAAERELTPEARHRRERAHVQPLVDYLDLPLEASYVSALEAAGYAVYGQSRWFNRVAVRAAGEPLLRLGEFPFVRRIAPVERARHTARAPEPATPERLSFREPSLPTAAQILYGQTLGQLSQLNVPAVHDSGYIGTAINVCVLDDGFNWYRKHEALRPIHVSGTHIRDFIRGVLSVQDTTEDPGAFEHGSQVLGALAGRKLGRYVGPAYDANLSLGRTEFDPTETTIEMVWWSMGAEWADSLGADIISSSLGYNVFPDEPEGNLSYAMLDGHTSVITRAAEIAAAKGILIVVSAGNDGTHSFVGYKVGAPADANGDSVLAIAAVDTLGVRAVFSSKGPTVDGRIKPDLAADGVSVLTPATDGDPNTYSRHSGTSFSAPLVAGLAACLMQARPTWPPVLIIEALKRTASRASHPDTLVGWGIPNGLAALRYVPDTLGAPDLRGPFAFRITGPNPLRAGSKPLSVHVALDGNAPATRFRVRVFDAGGRVVRDLRSGTLGPGSVLDFTWNGADAQGRSLVPGLYFVALDGAGQQDAVRVVVLR